MSRSRQWSLADLIRASIALAGIVLALVMLRGEAASVRVEAVAIGTTPAKLWRPPEGATAHGAVLVIAHGFAGSQVLMRSFALTAARNGYTAVTFDFAGHGRNPVPLAGSITEERGATRALQAETGRVVAFARGLGDGRVALLGHSMASDIVIRQAIASPDIAATIAVSMFSPAVTATEPRNLLVIVGAWEGMLTREALRAVGLATAPMPAMAGVTYGSFQAGSARRVAISPHVEHASVLFSQTSMVEALDWLDASFGVARASPPVPDGSGPWIMLLIAAVVLLAHPAARLLPRLADPPLGAGLGWRRFWPALLAPMIVTPLLLRLLPTHFLPVLVADYLAAHFAVYGLVTLACLWLITRRGTAGTAVGERAPWQMVLGAIAAVVAFGAIGLFWPIDRLVTSFVPGPERWLVLAAMLVGTALFFGAAEWLTRGHGAPRLAYAALTLAFLVSLALAVTLDFRRLFFLIIIVPVIVLFLMVYGLFSAWTYRATGHPLVAAAATALAIAWALGVTFPLLAG